MYIPLRALAARQLAVIGCQGRDDSSQMDSARSRQTADAAAPVTTDGANSAASQGGAKPPPSEPGTIPATPTPTVTTENALATMRQHLQRLDSASAQELQSTMSEHSKMLGDLLTTMRVEVQAATSPARNTWLASADSVEHDLNGLATAQGQELRTAFRAHSSRVRRLLDAFRTLVPARATT